MSVPTVPRAMYDGGNLDVEAINDNLRAIARNIKRNLDARYSTTSFRFPLNGMASTDAADVRTIRITGCDPATESGSWQVTGVEVVLYTDLDVVWTLTSSTHATWPGVTVTGGGAATEETAMTSQPLAVANTVDINFTASAASTITAGYVVITLTTDRNSFDALQYTPYVPSLLSSTSSTAGSLLDTELAAAAAAADFENASNGTADARVTCFATRNLASAGSTAVSLPSGLRILRRIAVLACAPVGATITAAVSSSGFATQTLAVSGAGVGSLAEADDEFGVNDNNAPGTPASDVTVTLSRGADGGALAPIAYVFCWWV